MSEQRHTASSITDVDLDRMYRRIETLEHVARSNLRHVQALVPELERAEAAIVLARGLHTKHEDSEHCQHDGEPWPCPTLAALDEAQEQHP